MIRRVRKMLRLFKECRRFYREIGYFPSFWNPSSFNEKLLWRKLYDRNPLFPIVSDKCRVREYVRDRLGPQRAKDLLVPVLQVTDRPETIAFSELPDEYVVKANHGSGWNIIVTDDREPPADEMVAQCEDWLSRTYGANKLEWAYQEIDPRILVEPLITDSEGKLPVDFKFYVFNGRVRFAQVFFDRLEGTKVTFFSREWEPLEVTRRDSSRGPVIDPPENLSEMIELSEQLAGPLDFVRVDLYRVEGEVYFSELTLYPGSGRIQYEPGEFDFEVGSWWDLPDLDARDRDRDSNVVPKQFLPGSDG